MPRTLRGLLALTAAASLALGACSDDTGSNNGGDPADAGGDTQMDTDAGGDTDGGVDTDTSAPEELTASFTVSDDATALSPVQFDASASADPQGANLTYAWAFGDGDTGSGVQTTHTYASAGDYEVVLTVSTGDGREATASQTVTVAEPQSAGPATLTGTVRDPTGGRLADVQVDVVGGESTTTDADGRYSVTVQTAVPQAVRFERDGYTVQLERLEIPAGEQQWERNTVMMRRSLPRFLTNPQDGGEVVGPNGASVTFEPNSLVDTDGDPVTGDVAVYITPVDVSDETQRDVFPGAFEGVQSDGSQGLLASFGVVEVVLRQGDAPVELAAGATADVALPVFTAGAAEGDQIPLWTLDERSGQWNAAGSATVASSGDSPTGLVAEGPLNLSLWYNLDVYGQPLVAELTFAKADSAGNPDGLLPAGTRCTLSGSNENEAVTGIAETFPADATARVGLWPDSPNELLAVAGNGRFIGRTTIEGSGGQTISQTVALRDRLADATPLNYGESLTESIPTQTGEMVFRFDVTAGSFSKIRVEAASGSSFEGKFTVFPPGERLASRSVLPGRASAQLFFSEADGAAFVVVEPESSATGDFTISLDEEIDFVPVELDTPVNATFQDGDTVVYEFRAEAGTVVTPHAFGLEQEASWYVVDAAGNRLMGAREGQAQFVELDSEGYYTVVVESQWPASPDTTDYTFVINEIQPPSPLGIDATRAVESDSIAVPGARRLYAFPVRPDDGVNVRVERTGGEQSEELVFRAFRVDRDFYRGRGAGTPATVRGSGAELGFESGDAEVLVVDVYDASGATPDFELTVDRVPGGLGTYVVDPAFACAGANARGLDAVSFAAADGDAVELCDGVHEVGDGVSFGQADLTVTGASQANTVISGWPGVPQTIERRAQGDFTLSTMTVEIRSRASVRSDGLSIGMSGTAPSLTLESLTVRPQDATTLVGQGISVSGTTDASVTLDRVEVVDMPDGATGVEVREADTTFLNSRIAGGDSGLRLDDCAPARVEDSEFTGQTAVAISQQGSAAGDASIQRNVIDYAGTSDFSYAVEISERGAGSAMTSTIADNDITLNCAECSGVELAQNASGSAIEFLRNRVVQAGATDGRMLEVTVNAGGEVGGISVVNNLFDGGADTAVRVRRGDQLDALRLVNNTIRLADGSTGVVRLVDIDGNTSGTWPGVEIFNNLLVGRAGATGDIGVDAAVQIDGDYNLFWQVATPLYQGGGTSSGNNDISGVDPLLDMSGVPSTGSPAIDAGTTTAAPPNDIDGVSRPQGSGTDIGAHER